MESCSDGEDTPAPGAEDVNAEIANPFIIKKRQHPIPAPLASLRSVCIFKKHMPRDIFYEFVQKISAAPIETSKLLHVLKISPGDAARIPAFYIIDINAFKRGIYLDIVHPFMEMMADQYYRPTHAFYAQRNMTGPAAFAQFIQVIRHICKYASLTLMSTLKYEQSISSRVYYVEYDHKERKDRIAGGNGSTL
jgi:hypothetical protein